MNPPISLPDSPLSQSVDLEMQDNFTDLPACHQPSLEFRLMSSAVTSKQASGQLETFLSPNEIHRNVSWRRMILPWLGQPGYDWGQLC